MTFSSEVHHIVKLIPDKQVFHQLTVADVALHKETTFIVYVIGNSTQVASVSQSIQYYEANVVVLLQHVFHKVRANKSGGSSNKISLHIIKSLFTNVNDHAL